MGIETAVIAGLGLASAIGQYNQSKSDARQTVKAGAIKAYNRADEIKSLASRQRVSYLQAGLELEGTPQTVVNDTYNKGIADVLSIQGVYNRESKNIMKTARAKLLGDIATAGISALSGGVGDGLENMGGNKNLTSNGTITGTIPVQPRKPLFAGAM